MKKIYLSAILLFIVTSSFAQHIGYIITINNDTIPCEKVSRSVKYDLFANAIDYFGAKYKVSNKDKFNKINIDSIKEYQTTGDSSIYRALTVDSTNKPQFYELLENGKICLYTKYEYKQGYRGSSKITFWYISKSNGPMYLIKKTDVLFKRDERKKELADMLSDNANVLKEFTTEDSFTVDNIRKYISDYNKEAANKK